jgi:hypothetical protein
MPCRNHEGANGRGSFESERRVRLRGDDDELAWKPGDDPGSGAVIKKMGDMFHMYICSTLIIFEFAVASPSRQQ